MNYQSPVTFTKSRVAHWSEMEFRNLMFSIFVFINILCPLGSKNIQGLTPGITVRPTEVTILYS